MKSNALWVMLTWGTLCEQRDTCENITFPPLRWRVKITIQNNSTIITKIPEIIILFPSLLSSLCNFTSQDFAINLFPFRPSAVALLTTLSLTLIQLLSRNRSSCGLRQVLTLDLSSSCKFVCFWFLLITDLSTNISLCPY